jgi:hypothetical protein
MSRFEFTYTHEDILRSARDAGRRLGLAPENNFDTLEAYWRDPAPFEAERVEGQAQINALFAPHEARIRAQMEAMWAAEEAGA